ncbi:MAG: IS1380 family transposase [Nitrospiraceae bacterium]
MRYGPKSLGVSFTGKTLTHFGGLFLLQQFLKRLDLRRLLQRHVRFAQRNNRYSVGEMVLALLYPIMLGLERLETTHLLTRNGVFQYLTGLPTYPNATTLRRFLLRMAPAALPKLRRLHDGLLNRVTEHDGPNRFIFDLDSTVVVVYGKQEQARIGYNPFKRGRPSYHPLLCFEGISRDFWHGELRAGDAHTAQGTVALLEACFAKLPTSVRRVQVRADSGFYSRKLIEWLEDKQAGFAIVARLTRPLKNALPFLRYTVHRGGIETAEFFYEPHKWPHPYRFIAIRRLRPEDPSEQLTLFSTGRYSYQVLVTNLELQPLNLWRFYNDRAAIELIVRELKGDYPLGRIPTKHFFANEAYFHLLLLAYNLINWFKRLCLPAEFRAMTLGTLRSRLLLAPAQLTRTNNRPTLKLPENFLYQQVWHHTLKQIERLRL